MGADGNDNDEAMASGDADPPTAAAAAKEDVPAAMDADGDDGTKGSGGADDAPTYTEGKAEGSDRDEEQDARDPAAGAVPEGDGPPRAWAVGGICLPIASVLALVSLGQTYNDTYEVEQYLIILLGLTALAVPALLATGLLVFYLLLLLPLSCFREKMLAVRSDDPDAAGRRPSALALRVLDAWFTCNVWALLAASAAISLAIAVTFVVAFVQSTSQERCAFADGAMTADTGTYGSLEIGSSLEKVPHDGDGRVLAVGEDDFFDDDNGILFSEDDMYGRDDCDYSLLSSTEDYAVQMALVLSISAAMLCVGALVLRYIRPRAREEGADRGDGPTAAADGTGLELPDRAEETEAEGEESVIPAIV